jgi:hypothetical protein
LSFGSPCIKDKVLLEEESSKRIETKTLFYKAVAGAALEQELAQEVKCLRGTEIIEEEKVAENKGMDTLAAPSVESLTKSKAEYNVEATNRAPFYATIVEYPVEIGKKFKGAHNLEATELSVDVTAEEPLVMVEDKNREVSDLESTSDPVNAAAEEPPVEIETKNNEANNLKATKDSFKATIADPFVKCEQKFEKVYNLDTKKKPADLDTTKKPADASIEELHVEIGEKIKEASNLEAITDGVDSTTTEEPPVEIKEKNKEAHNLEAAQDSVEAPAKEPLVESEQKVEEAYNPQVVKDSVELAIADPLVESEQKVEDADNLDTIKEPVDASIAELLVKIGEEIKEEYILDTTKDVVDATTEEPPVEIEEKSKEAHNLEAAKDSVEAPAEEPLVESEQKVEDAYNRDTTKERVDASINELFVEVGLKIKEEYNLEIAKEPMDATATEELPVEIEAKSKDAHNLEAAQDSFEAPAKELLAETEKPSFIFQFNSSRVEKVALVQEEESPKAKKPLAVASYFDSPVEDAKANIEAKSKKAHNLEAAQDSFEAPAKERLVECEKPSFVFQFNSSRVEKVAILQEEASQKTKKTLAVASYLDSPVDDAKTNVSSQSLTSGAKAQVSSLDISNEPDPSVQSVKKIQEPARTSFPKSSTESSEDVQIITEGPLVEVVATQQVLDMDLKDYNVSSSLTQMEKHPIEFGENSKEPSLFSSVLKSSKDHSGSIDAVSISEDWAVEVTASQQVLETNLNDDDFTVLPSVEEHSVEKVEKSKGPSLFSFMNSSKHISDKDEIFIAEDTAAQAADTQKVLDKALKIAEKTKEPTLLSVEEPCIEIAEKTKEPILLSVEEPYIEIAEKSKGPSLFSFMNSSKDSSEKEAIVIAEDPALQNAAAQIVLDKTREPPLSSVLKSSNDSVEDAVAIDEDPAAEVAFLQQVLNKDLKHDRLTASPPMNKRPVEIAVKESEEPSLFSILKASKNTSDKVTVAIAKVTADESAAAQQVLNKAPKHNGVTDTLHGYMQDLAREETRKIMAQKKPRVWPTRLNSQS